MIRLFKHYLPRSLLVLGLFEVLLIFLAAFLAWRLGWFIADSELPPVREQMPEFLVFTATVYISMLGLGAYQLSVFRSLRMSGARLSAAMLISVVVLSFIVLLVPELVFWRAVIAYAIILSFLFVILSRFVFLKLIDWKRFREPIIVMGAGRQGQRLRQMASEPEAGFRIVKHLSLSQSGENLSISEPLSAIDSLADYCSEHSIEEIVLALDERRGSLPSGPLLEAKMSGVNVADMSTFLERMTGRVDLGSVHPSWLIFSDGFLGSRAFAVVSKRMFDLFASGLLLILSSPVLLAAAAAVWASSPGPVFYRQERVGQFGRVFKVMKFRSMVQDAEKDGAQWAQAKDPRVTRIGGFLRKDADRRDTADLQRLFRRYELRRSASGTARLRRRTGAGNSVLQ